MGYSPLPDPPVQASPPSLTPSALPYTGVRHDSAKSPKAAMRSCPAGRGNALPKWSLKPNRAVIAAIGVRIGQGKGRMGSCRLPDKRFQMRQPVSYSRQRYGGSPTGLNWPREWILTGSPGPCFWPKAALRCSFRLPRTKGRPFWSRLQARRFTAEFPSACMNDMLRKGKDLDCCRLNLRECSY